MDPFSLNMLGTIRQQEILEQAGQDRKGARLWWWELEGLRLSRRVEPDGVILEDVLGPALAPPRRPLGLWQWLKRLGAQPAAAQPMRDAQCAPDC